MNKIFVDVGIEETFITVVKQNEDSRGYIKTQKETGDSFKDLANKVVELFFQKAIHELHVDTNGIGLGLADELLGKFKSMGYGYNIKEGKVFIVVSQSELKAEEGKMRLLKHFPNEYTPLLRKLREHQKFGLPYIEYYAKNYEEINKEAELVLKYDWQETKPE